MPDDSAGRARGHAAPEHSDTAPPRTDRPAQGLATRLSHAGRAGTRVHGFVNPPVHRGSTVLYPDCAGRVGAAKRRFDQYLTYGTQGGPTHYALEDMGAEVEGGTRCLIVEDVVTTGLSSREAIAAIARAGGEAVAAAALVDRSDGTADLGVPFFPLIRLDVPTYEADALPPELQAVPAVKPGSRAA